MSITLYREGLPRVELQAPHTREAMLVGFVESDGMVAGLVMLEDGALGTAALDAIRIQYHYDVETDQWIDENAPEPDQE